MLDVVKSAALKGIQWRSVQVCAGLLIHIGSLTILARLLTPAEYGIYAFGMVFFELILIAAQFGLGASIVWSSAIQPRHLQSLFGCSLFLSTLGAGLLSAGSAFGNSKDLSEVFLVLAFGLFFRASSTIPEGVLTRQLRYSALAKIEVFNDLVFATVAIGCAFSNLGALSLAVATAAQQAARSLIFLSLCPIRPRRGELRLVASFIRYGSWTGASRVTGTIGRIGDSWVLGQMASSEALGLYNRAIRLARLPGDLVQGVFGSLLFPSFSALRADQHSAEKAFFFAVALLFFLAAPMTIATFILAPELVQVFLGDTWLAAVPVVQALAALSVLNPVAKCADDFLRSANRMRFMNAVYVTYALMIVSLGALGAVVASAVGVAVAVVFANIVRAYLLISECIKLSRTNASVLAMLVPGLVSSLLTVGGLLAWQEFSSAHDFGKPLYLIIGLGVSTLLLLGSALLCPGRFAEDIRRQGRRAAGLIPR